jgi:hypothetical protein
MWRRILDLEPNIASAAANTLRGTSADKRPLVERALLSPPASVSARLALAQLELGWGAPSVGWAALKELPPTLAAVAAWIEFGGDAEEIGESLMARDAFALALGSHPSADLLLRAAAAALAGGDPRGTIGLLDRMGDAAAPSVGANPLVGPYAASLRIRALARLGRGGDAERVMQGSAAPFDGALRADLEREITWGYVRAGEVQHAREAAQRFGLAGDRAISGWLALYGGDLANARHGLDAAPADAADIVMAMALLARTRADSSAAIGQAFVQLARGDTTGAAATFAGAATSAALSDAAPLLLATAARLHTARHEDDLALPLWRRVVEQYTTAPEAPEADLEWGRALKRRDDLTAAVERWQHLILTYPESALVPQARRELDLAKAAA